MDIEKILTLITECKELIALKGSKGSGGWGHSGRPGKHGGSKTGSGGLSKIGAKPGSSIDERKKLAGKKKAPSKKPNQSPRKFPEVLLLQW